MSFSMEVPENQPLMSYGTDDTEWNSFCQALERIPKGFDVPMIIGGEEVRSSERMESIDPSTGDVFCTTQKAEAEHTRMAIDAAMCAKDGWAALPPENRILKFRDLEQILLDRRHEICAVVQRNNRLVVNSRMDVFVICAAILPANGKSRYLEILHKRSSHIVLGAQRIRCAENNIRPAVLECPY